MKTLLTFFLILFVTLDLFAGEINYDVKSTDVLRDKLMERSAGLKAIGSINEHAFILFQPITVIYDGSIVGGGKLAHYITKFDKNLNIVKKTKLDLDLEGKKVDFEGVQIMDEKMFVFFSFQNEAQKKHYLFARTMNIEEMVMEDDTKMIAELDYSGISKYNRTSVQYEVSADISKILFFYSILNKKNEPLRFTIRVYDNALNSIWENNVSPDFEAGVFRYDQFRVDNNGDVYLLGTHYLDRKNYLESAKFNDYDFFSKDTYFTDVPNFTYQLYKFSNNGRDEVHRDIQLDSKFVRSLNINVFNGKAHVNGIFSDPHTISARGAFSFEFDVASGKQTALSTENFTTELMEKGFTEKELKRFQRSINDKSEYDPFDYLISEIKELSDGSKYFTAEQYITGTKRERVGNQTVYTPLYLYNDVFIIRLNANHSIEKIEKISKRQYSLTTSRYNSFIDFEKNGDLYFIYNTIKKKDTLFKNAEIGETYISKMDGDNTLSEVYKTPESEKEPLIMPITKVVFPNHSVLYGMMSSNFKDYKFEVVNIE